MGLVEVAEVEREPRPVALAAGHPLGRLVQADALQDPFGRDAHVLAEEPLQRALGVAGERAQLIHTPQLRVGEDRRVERTDLLHAGIVGRLVRPHPRLHDRDPVGLGALQCERREDGGDRDRPVRERVCRHRVKRMEATRPELRRDGDPA